MAACVSTLRMSWLALLVRCNEDGAVRTARPGSAALCALCDALAVFPGRAGAPWSLGSVLGAAVARFLPHVIVGPLGGFATFDTPVNHIACSRDAAQLYAVTDTALHVFDRATGALLRRLTEAASAPFVRLVFVSVADDGGVYVVDRDGRSVIVFAPDFQHRATIRTPGESQCAVAFDTHITVSAAAALYTNFFLLEYDRTSYEEAGYWRLHRTDDLGFSADWMCLADYDGPCLVLGGYVDGAGTPRPSAAVVVLDARRVLKHWMVLPESDAVTGVSFHAPSKELVISSRRGSSFEVGSICWRKSSYRCLVTSACATVGAVVGDSVLLLRNDGRALESIPAQRGWSTTAFMK